MTNELNRWENEGGRTHRDEVAEVRDHVIDALSNVCPNLLHDSVLVNCLLSVVFAEVGRVLAERRVHQTSGPQ